MSQQPIPAPSTFPTPDDLKDLQGDVVLGFPKKVEAFIFFAIKDVTGFKHALKQLAPHITSTAKVQEIRKQIDEHKKNHQPGLVKALGVNIAFTFPGLKKLGATDSLGDPEFEQGQLAAAKTLGDSGTTDASGNFDPAWIPGFKQEIDGVVLVAGECEPSIKEVIERVEHIIGGSKTNVLTVNGVVRPGPEKGHEHFGFLDGISSPAVEALTGHLPGQQVVNPGVLILGQQGDPVTTRPAWAKNGSFLVYRQLEQLVPEFEKFLTDNPIILPGLTREKGSELLGARLVGRWKSGAPIDITPLEDNKDLAKDPQKNNNFDFSDATDQSRCPFSAHIRKTNPRTDLPQPAVQQHSIVRQGIPFGPEVSDAEKASGKTQHGVSRGLAFVCYQSKIGNGFAFLQESWANNQTFPPKKDANGQTLQIGFDPIIGTNGGDSAGRKTFGTNPSAQGQDITLPVEWVVPKGGAYFFSPSISTITNKLAV